MEPLEIASGLDAAAETADNITQHNLFVAAATLIRQYFTPLSADKTLGVAAITEETPSEPEPAPGPFATEPEYIGKGPL